MRKGHRHQIILTGEVLIEGALRDTGAGGDFVHRHTQKTLTPKQAERGIEDAQPRLLFRPFHSFARGLKMNNKVY
jgi:hypothetical protein